MHTNISFFLFFDGMFFLIWSRIRSPKSALMFYILHLARFRTEVPKALSNHRTRSRFAKQVSFFIAHYLNSSEKLLTIYLLALFQSWWFHRIIIRICTFSRRPQSRVGQIDKAKCQCDAESRRGENGWKYSFGNARLASFSLQYEANRA